MLSRPPSEEICKDERAGVEVRPTASEAVAAAATALAGLGACLALGLEWPPALAGACLAAAMIVIALIDRRSFLVPDWLSLPAIPLGIIAAGSAVDIRADVLVPPGRVAGAAVGALSLFLLAHAYRRLRGREGLGLGDVKLAAVAGAWVGVAALPDVLLVACAGALIALALERIRDSGRELRATTALPFGAFLAPAIWIVWFWRQASGIW